MEYQNVVLFSDLDGTLFDKEDRVSERDREAIRKLTENGGVFAVSSGRPMFSAMPQLSGVNVNGPCIFHNGSSLYSGAEDKYLKFFPLDEKRVLPFLIWVRDTFPGIDVQIHTAEDLFYITPEETADMDFVRRHLQCRFVTPKEVHGLYLKTLFDGDPEKLELIRAQGEKELGDIVDLVYSTPRYLEVLPKGINKGTALANAIRYGGLEGRTVLAVGDFDNDLQLLRAADVAIAPDNALDEVKAVCQYVVRPNTDSAIADIIDRIIPQL